MKSVYELTITDQAGRTIEKRTIMNTGQSIKLGRNYRAGVYIAELRQGQLVKKFKLIKL
jgi:hypothetical protein